MKTSIIALILCQTMAVPLPSFLKDHPVTAEPDLHYNVTTGVPDKITEIVNALEANQTLKTEPDESNESEASEIEDETSESENLGLEGELGSMARNPDPIEFFLDPIETIIEDPET